MKRNPKFIIHTPSFNENIGGIIALHYLCHLINELGYQAFLFRAILPPTVNSEMNYKISITRRIIRFLKNRISTFKTYQYFNSPVYRGKLNDDCIVIYSEMINGNPLKAKNIVRWFLNKPGKLTGEVNYGENELYFFYQEVFNDENLNKNKDNLLRVMYTFDDVYKQTNFGERKGSCYILRKGKGRELIHDLNDSILIDGKSHGEIARIFNSVEYCYSYDLYTFYSYYATLCGCKSVVIPDKDLTKEDWQPDLNLQLGLAYGLKDLANIDFEKQKGELAMYLLADKKKTNESVQLFINKCEKYFLKN